MKKVEILTSAEEVREAVAAFLLDITKKQVVEPLSSEEFSIYLADKGPGKFLVRYDPSQISHSEVREIIIELTEELPDRLGFQFPPYISCA